MNNIDYSLYGVTDPGCNPSIPLEQQVEQAILGGMTVVQLRDKDASKEQIAAQAVRIKAMTDRYQIPLLINDYPDVAAEVGAAGVHIGQSDMEFVAAKKILPEGSIIGVSASSLEEAVQAEKAGADYLGVGAMIYTPTKPDARLISKGELQQICQTVRIPVVIIGGINEKTMELFADTGISGIAVVSALFGAQNIQEAAKRLSGWRK